MKKVILLLALLITAPVFAATKDKGVDVPGKPVEAAQAVPTQPQGQQLQLDPQRVAQAIEALQVEVLKQGKLIDAMKNSSPTLKAAYDKAEADWNRQFELAQQLQARDKQIADMKAQHDKEIAELKAQMASLNQKPGTKE